MMNAKEIARGGLLAAAAVALLYIGGAAPYFGPAACIVAGVTSAVPLLRRARLRISANFASAGLYSSPATILSYSLLLFFSL